MAAPTNKERLDGLETRLGEIEIALGLKPPRPKSAFRKSCEHLWQQIKTHKTTIIPVTAIIVGAVGWFVGGWFKYYLDHRYDLIDGMISGNLNSRGGVRDTLAAVQQTVNRTDATLSTLQPFIQDIIRHEFESASKLPTATLQERLPAMQHLLAIAKDQQFAADATTLDALTRKLSAANPRASGFWPTAAEFISYRSQTAAPDSRSLLRPDLPTCADSDPTPMKILEVSPDRHTFSASSAYYENCRLVLDSPKEKAKINDILLNMATKLTFRHCFVIYRGGPIDLIVAFNNRPVTATVPGHADSPVELTATGPTLYLENCLFKFVLLTSPPPNGQDLTRTLLAATGRKIAVPILHSSTHS